MALHAAIWEQISEAAVTTLDEMGKLGETHAKRLAPVRKVFYTGRRAVKRTLSQAEIATLPRSVRAGIVPNTAIWGPGTRNAGKPVQVTERRSGASQYDPVVRVAKGQRGVKLPHSSRTLIAIGTGATNRQTGRPSVRYGLVMNSLLTSRGRYELEHAEERGAAYRAPGGETTLGGTLRGEIGWSWIQQGPVFVIQIESPQGGKGRSAAYSRYVELPTSRTAAQPYLRPTLQHLKRPLVRHFNRNLEAIGKR